MSESYKLPFPIRKFNCQTPAGRLYMRLACEPHESLLKRLDWNKGVTGQFIHQRDAIQLIIHREIVAQNLSDETHSEYHHLGLTNPVSESHPEDPEEMNITQSIQPIEGD